MTAWLVGGAFAIVGLSLIVFAGLQDRLLYFPERTSVAGVVSARLRAWPAAGEFRGLLALPAGPARGTAVVFHGNAGHAGQREYYAAILTDLGLRVVLAEYPGYGPRSGRLGEQSFVDDAEQTIVRAEQLYGPPLIVIGESLGAAVAAASAARHAAALSGLILLTPWDRLVHVAEYHYPFLPARWLLRDRYDSVRHLAQFDRPVVVAVAAEDQIVPARFGQSLFDSIRAPKRLVVIPGAEHNDWKLAADERWWREATDFVLPRPP